MNKSLVIPDVEYLPPELLLDKHHPANSEYMQNLNSIKRLIVTRTVCMKTIHVDIVKRKLAGALNRVIADELNLTPPTIGNVLRREDAQRLRALLEHFNLAMDGPNDAHRRRVLWEIALDNKDIEPKVSISSIQEINRMNGTYNTATKDTAINITINNNLLPKGRLDL